LFDCRADWTVERNIRPGVARTQVFCFFFSSAHKVRWRKRKRERGIFPHSRTQEEKSSTRRKNKSACKRNKDRAGGENRKGVKRKVNARKAAS